MDDSLTDHACTHVPICSHCSKVLNNTLPPQSRRDENTRHSWERVRLIPENNAGNNNADLPSFASTDLDIHRIV